MTDSRRVLKNTTYLYVRMLIVTIVTLYTSRITLQILGFNDYGIYTVVAGFVSIFSSLVNMMTGATQRFITFELGKGKKERLNKVFSISLSIHLGLAFIFLILAETGGLWYVFNRLVIPQGSLNAAVWTYQFAVLSGIVVMTQIPYNAIIIAYEKMKIFALMSIIEVVLKLGLTAALLLIKNTSLNILIWYSFFMFVSSLIVRILYIVYAVRVIPESKFSFCFEKNTVKKMMAFTGWSTYGTIAYLAINQYIPVVLNKFFGTIVNAAMGIANQVAGTIYGFVSNFQMAFKPQIVKLYAQSQFHEMNRLIYLSSKFSYIIMFIVSFPVLGCTDYILHLWLSSVPPYTAIFCKLTILYGMIDTLVIPIRTAVEATGKIRTFQLVVGTFFLLYVPVSYIMLKNGFAPESILMLKVIMGAVILCARLLIVKRQISGFSINGYCKAVIIPLVCGSIIPTIAYFVYTPEIDDIVKMLVVSLIYILIGGLSLFMITLNKNEKRFVFSILKTKIGFGRK